ncbi:MAG TPA: type II secretion system protein PulP [Geomonas sp.]|nr:type II secretion system protein PulP [Geomonas sp.]
MNRQKATLAVLVIVLACSVLYAIIRSPRQREATPQELRRQQPAAGKSVQSAPPAGQPGKVELALLDREPPRFAAPRRDIFSPVFKEEVKLPPFKPLPPLPPPKPPRTLNLPPAPPMQAPPPPPPPTPEQQAENEMRKLTVLGFLKKNGNKTVFLSFNDQILLARKGATLLNKFVVKDITDEAITLRPANGGNEVVIPLVDNKALPRQAGKTR